MAVFARVLKAVVLLAIIIGVAASVYYRLASSATEAAAAEAAAAVVAALTTIGGLLTAWKQIGVSNSIRRTELIGRVYEPFVADKDLYRFYERIRDERPIDWQHDRDDERLLNRSLTLFDEVAYLQTQQILGDDKTWEYVAAEIQYFNDNRSVWNYWAKRVQEGLDRKLPSDIIPFTGFPELLRKMPGEFRWDKFKADPFRYVPEEASAVLDELARRRATASTPVREKVLGRLPRGK